jgi:hypothetical protein
MMTESYAQIVTSRTHTAGRLRPLLTILGAHAVARFPPFPWSFAGCDPPKICGQQPSARNGMLSLSEHHHKPPRDPLSLASTLPLLPILGLLSLRARQDARNRCKHSISPCVVLATVQWLAGSLAHWLVDSLWSNPVLRTGTVVLTFNL